MTTHEQHLQDEVAVPAAEEPQSDEQNRAFDPEPVPVADEPGAAAAPEPQPAAGGHESSPDTGLFADSDVADLRARWAGVQAAFVDDPKDCVQQADHLVSDLVEQLTTGFAQARSRLEEEWSQGRDASTEDLRMALMHYREFFDRLLGV
jgi:hypothetical protein